MPVVKRWRREDPVSNVTPLNQQNVLHPQLEQRVYQAIMGGLGVLDERLRCCLEWISEENKILLIKRRQRSSNLTGEVLVRFIWRVQRGAPSSRRGSVKTGWVQKREGDCSVRRSPFLEPPWRFWLSWAFGWTKSSWRPGPRWERDPNGVPGPGRQEETKLNTEGLELKQTTNWKQQKAFWKLKGS